MIFVEIRSDLWQFNASFFGCIGSFDNGIAKEMSSSFTEGMREGMKLRWTIRGYIHGCGVKVHGGFKPIAIALFQIISCFVVTF